ncbi:fibrinogen alpha chain [Eublepharis macularius]|uniref:Fibrinogen alpha chain n=1 Tax=Eublepharis macularius TaxID=481883 RepID=A0AA97LBE9_EUBMA|nr:fibrinogen alpha chain [Eublepharis macularius]
MFQMRIFCVLLCFSISWAAEGESTFEEHGGGVRGPRIVEHKAQSDCKQDKGWPLCADDDWGSKCPSGCRMQGLIDETDHDFSDRINKLKKLLSDNQNSYKKAVIVKQETVDVLSQNLLNEQDRDNSYGQLSDDLRRRLVTLKQRVVTQLSRIRALQNSIRNQVTEINRLEVDIDIKVRACHGSCTQRVDYHVNTDSYDNIQKQLVQVSAINSQPEFQSSPLRVLKIQPVKDSSVSERYKTLRLSEEDEKILNKLKLYETILEGPESESRGSTIVTKHVVSAGSSDRQPHTSKIVTPGYREGTPEEAGSSTKIKVSSTGGGSGFSDLSHLSGVKEFFTPESGSRIHGTHTHVVHIEGPDVISELGEGEDDDFRGVHVSPEFHSKTTGVSSHSRTIVTSSSSTSSFNKGGSTFETKSLKISSPFEEHSVQLDESGEDAPDFRARSLRTGGEKLGESYIGTDCEDIHQKHTSGAKSGIFRIKPAGSAKVFSVYCDQDTSLGGWLLIQQRFDGSLNFNRTWEDYKKGFGSVDGKGNGELWLGNENLHILTQEDTVLRVEVEDWEGNEAYAEYYMQIGSELEGYSLSVSDYEGTAGDALIIGSEEEGSEYTAHANMKFSTFDRDNDQWEENCAEVYGGGWWYNNCQAANLNGIYYSGGQYDPRNNIPYEIENGVVWVPFKPSDYSLKVVKMKIRPVETD